MCHIDMYYIGVGKVMTSGSLGGEMVSTLALNVGAVDSIPALGTIFPSNFSSPLWHWCSDQDTVKLRNVWLLNLPCVYIMNNLLHTYKLMATLLLLLSPEWYWPIRATEEVSCGPTSPCCVRGCPAGRVNHTCHRIVALTTHLRPFLSVTC